MATPKFDEISFVIKKSAFKDIAKSLNALSPQAALVLNKAMTSQDEKIAMEAAKFVHTHQLEVAKLMNDDSIKRLIEEARVKGESFKAKLKTIKPPVQRRKVIETKPEPPAPTPTVPEAPVEEDFEEQEDYEEEYEDEDDNAPIVDFNNILEIEDVVDNSEESEDYFDDEEESGSHQ